MGTIRYTVIDGEVIAEKRNGVRHEYVPDPLGSTVALLDNTQAQTDTFDYWPYGEESNRTGTTATPFRYAGTWGQYRDSSTRDYVRARVLDKQKGRWLTQDPIGFNGADWNLYSYVTNRPIIFVDPTGLRAHSHNPNNRFGDKDCRRWFGAGWHSCSSDQWDHCLGVCKKKGDVAYAQSNVAFCCSNNDRVGSEKCHCINTIKPPKTPYKWPLPGCGIGQHIFHPPSPLPSPPPHQGVLPGDGPIIDPHADPYMIYDQYGHLQPSPNDMGNPFYQRPPHSTSGLEYPDFPR